MNNFLLVFIGGGLGSMARYGVSVLFMNHVSSSFPWATLVANAVSSLILGLLIGHLHQRQGGSEFLYLLIAVGFCGGFSTFSTFSAETIELLRQGAFTGAFLNSAANLLTCFSALWLGLSLSK
jgi:fluoride exporter